MSNSEQHQWIVAVKDSVLQSQSKDDDSRPVFVKLRHPKSDEGSMFMFTNSNKDIYEVMSFKEKYSSWIIGQSVQQDGSMFMTTPIDPIFLVLPYLMDSSQSGKYMTLDQIVTDDKYHECHRLPDSLGTNQLNHVADVKGDDDFKAYRYNKDKTLKWLKQKVEKLSKVLEEKSVHVTGGAQVASYIRSTKSDNASEDDYARYAHGMISEYVSEDLGNTLKEFLGIQDKKDNIKVEEPPNKKIKTEKPAPLEDYSTSNGNADKNKKTSKLSVAQKKLAKVDKTGMKSLASFFSPKPKK